MKKLINLASVVFLFALLSCNPPCSEDSKREKTLNIYEIKYIHSNNIDTLEVYSYYDAVLSGNGNLYCGDGTHVNDVRIYRSLNKH